MRPIDERTVWSLEPPADWADSWCSGSLAPVRPSSHIAAMLNGSTGPMRRSSMRPVGGHNISSQPHERPGLGDVEQVIVVEGGVAGWAVAPAGADVAVRSDESDE